jgi:hypothetical protein
MTFAAGYFVGKLRAEDEATKMRRWWMQRETRKTRERK